MRYGPTDSNRPPHPDCSRDRGLVGAGRLQELDEASQPDAREFGGGEFGRGVRFRGELGGVGRRPGLGILGCCLLGRVVRCTAVRDTVGHLTGPSCADPDPEPHPDAESVERNREGQPLAVRTD